MITDVAVLRNDMGYARGMLDEIATKMGTLLDRMESGFSDLSATPAGRAVLDRLDDHDGRLDQHERELKDVNRNISNMLEDRKVERAERQLLGRLVKAGMALTTFISTVAGLLWALHLMGVMR